MNSVKLNREMFLNNKLDTLIKGFEERDCVSMGEYENEREPDPRKIYSYPSTPEGYRQDLNVLKLKALQPPDNVYAEARPTKKEVELQIEEMSEHSEILEQKVTLA